MERGGKPQALARLKGVQVVHDQSKGLAAHGQQWPHVEVNPFQFHGLSLAGKDGNRLDLRQYQCIHVLMLEDSQNEAARQLVLLNTLRQCPLFADMAPRDLEDIATTCETIRLDKSETLFRENEKALGFYIVQQGAIHLHRLTADGHEQVIAVFRPFNCFAEICLTTFHSYPADAVALEPSVVVLVRKADFRGLIMRTPELALRMLASMSFHLKHLLQTMEDQKFKRIESRLSHHLLRLCPMIERENNAVVRLNSSKKILAGQLGVSSETLSRSLARFRREKLIEVDGPKIRILDIQGLRAYLEDQ